MITLDDTDQDFIIGALSHCIAILGLRMTDPNVCEASRDRAMEYRKMAVKARNIVYGAQAIQESEVSK